MLSILLELVFFSRLQVEYSRFPDKPPGDWHCLKHKILLNKYSTNSTEYSKYSVLCLMNIPVIFRIVLPNLILPQMADDITWICEKV